MNRITKALSVSLLALGLAVVGVPLASGGDGAVVGTGSTGCCKQ